VLVIDPGMFSERAALGADAVLITHEHTDHLDVSALADELGRRRCESSARRHRGQARRPRPLVTPVASGKSSRRLDWRSGRSAAGTHRSTRTSPGTEPGLPVAESLPPGRLTRRAARGRGGDPVRPDLCAVAQDGGIDQLVRAVSPRRAFALHDYLPSDPGSRWWTDC
jgi:hypothetical protein